MSFCLNDFFFLQAEDGIRVGHVTGVQTCALPIFSSTSDTDSAALSDRVDRSQIPVPYMPERACTRISGCPASVSPCVTEMNETAWISADVIACGNSICIWLSENAADSP